MPIEIKNLQESDQERWDKYVLSVPKATFFHKCGWKEVIEKAFGHRAYYLYAERDGEIEGVLPLVHLRSLLFGNGLSSMPFCAYGGVVASNDIARLELDQAACSLAKALRVDYLEYRNREPCNSNWVKKDLYVTFRKGLDPDPEKNFKAIPRKQRAMVRKGIEAGLQSEVDDTIDRFYDAYSQSVRNLGTPVFSRRYFQLLKNTFTNECDVLTITQDNRTISSVLSFYFRDEVLPYYGGGTNESRNLKGNDFMYWELMRRCSARDIRVFDFGRSKLGTGSYRFKKHWGFVPEPLHYEYHLVNAKQVPNVSPANPKYRFFIETWRRLPLSITRLVGPWFARNLG